MINLRPGASDNYKKREREGKKSKGISPRREVVRIILPEVATEDPASIRLHFDGGAKGHDDGSDQAISHCQRHDKVIGDGVEVAFPGDGRDD